MASGSSSELDWAMEADRASAKRKSVSFVDEKLILDALNSTNSTTNGNGSGKPQPHSRSSSGDMNGKSNGRHHHSNGRSNHGHGNSNGYSKGGSHYNKSANSGNATSATNGAKNNAVIVYYTDPQSSTINVDQLLTTTEPAVVKNGSGGQQTNGHHNNNQQNNKFVPKSGQSNGHHHHSQHQRDHHREHNNRDHNRDYNQRQHKQGALNGADERRGNQFANGHSPSKFADNWRTKGLRMDQPQYQPVKERIGNGHHKASGRGQQHSTNKAGMPQLQSPSTTNGKLSGPFSKSPSVSLTAVKQSEPITIYYTTPECSTTDVIEQNLKQLQLKQKEATETDSNSENKGGNSALEAPTPNDASASTSTTTSSQVNVIKGEEEKEKETNAKSQSPPPKDDTVKNSTSDTTEVPIMPPALVTHSSTSGGDQYDVITGGVPIEGATLPVGGEKHPLRCTLVSHPGHFYVTFVDPASEAVLASMNEFYNLEEHLIELSVELLKPGQYFAACRTRPPTSVKEWIRVQLQSVEGAELINCLLIDEGCFGIFKIGDLQPLYNQFRAVAKQAVRASLSGVIPKDIDWLPQQSLDFKKLVSDRPLHSGGQVFDQAAFEAKQCLQLELYFADGEDGLAERSVADVVVERDIASKK